MNNSSRRSTSVLSALVGLLFMFSDASFGMPVQVDFSGSVNTVVGNALGLSVGDSVSGTTTYNDALLTGVGSEFIELGTTGNDFGGTLLMNMGAVSFMEFEDTGFSGIYPELEFLDGALIGFDFVVDDKPNQYDNFEAYGTEWEFFGSDGVNNNLRAAGVWNYFSAPVAIGVPEPATLALLGIGLAGLGWVGQRRRKT